MKLKHFAFSLLLGLLWFPVSAQKMLSEKNVHLQQMQPDNLKPADNSQIIYYTFHIKKTVAHPEGELTLVNSKILQGHIKQLKDTAIANGKKGQLLVALKDSKGNITTQSIINNPLEERVEYMKEGGELGETTVTKSETDFLVRMPYSDGCSLNDVKVFKEDKIPVKISSLTINSNK